MNVDKLSYDGRGVKRLLIFAPNWLGDAIMALPAIADLRRALPAAAVDVAARPAVAPLFTMVDGIGAVVVLQRRNRLTRDFAADLRDRAYDAALLLPNSLQSAITAWRASLPERWGYATDLRAALLTRAVKRPAGRLHQAEYYQHLTRALGMPAGPLEPRIVVTDESRRHAAGVLAAAGWDEQTPLVALAPGAAYGGAKRWPAESFAALADGLAADGVATVLVGSAGDRAAAAEVIDRATGTIGAADGATLRLPMSLVGATDLPTLGGVLAHCRGLVSNDSGAMHFAAAAGVRVVAMFGPTEEWSTRPLGRTEPTVLVHDVWCRPCMLRECPIDHRCMRGITVARVLAAARS